MKPKALLPFLVLVVLSGFWLPLDAQQPQAPDQPDTPPGAPAAPAAPAPSPTPAPPPATSPVPAPETPLTPPTTPPPVRPAAEDPPVVDDRPPAAEPDKPKPAVERNIYIPYEDLEKIFEQEGRGVFLPYREFLELWDQLTLHQKKEAEKPPADAVLSSATYTATIEGDDDRVMVIDALLQVESFKEGWAVLPLIQKGLNIAEVEAGEATVHLGNNGYEVILPRKGQYEIKARMYAKVDRTSGRNSVSLNLPKAGVSKFEAVIPEKGWNFEIQPAAAYSSEPVGDNATRLAFFFGEADHFEISWQKQGEETKLTPLLFVEADGVARVTPGAIQTDLSLNYRILRAGVDTFTLSAPEAHEILNVDGENIKEWDVVTEGGQQKLTVQLHSAAKQAYTLKLTVEKPLDTLPAEVDAPEVQTENVVRQRGSFTVLASEELDLETVTLTGMTQQSVEGDASGDLQNGMTRFGRFRYLTTPFALVLSAERAEPVVDVESYTVVTVEPDAAEFRATFEYEVKRVGIFETRIVIPADFESIEVTGSTVDDFSEETVDGNRVLVVKFTRQSMGAFTFVVAGQRLRATADEDLTVPVFAPEGVDRHEGKVGLAIHTSLDPNTKDPGDLRQQDVSLLGLPVAQRTIEANSAEAVQAAGNAIVQGQSGNGGIVQVDGNQRFAEPVVLSAETPLTTGFRYRGTAAPAVLGFKLKESQVNGEVFTLVDVREQVVRFEWRIRYNVLYAGVDTFVFSLPETIVDDLRVDGPGIKETDKAYQLPEGAEPLPEGRVAWAVVLRDKRLGQYELKLTLERPLGALETGQTFDVEIPEIRLERIFRETGQMAVIKDDSLEILKADAKSLEQIDPKELDSALYRAGIFLAYKYRQHPLSLKVSVSRNEYLAVPQAIITDADLSTVVAEDRAMTTEVVYWVKNNSKQFLSVQLPEGGKMVSDVYVAGAAQQPMHRPEQNEVLIRLPAGQEQRADAFPVRFVYSVPSDDPGSKLGMFGRLLVTPPALTDVSVLQTQLNLYLPHDYVYTKFKSAMRLPQTTRGWNRFQNLFDPLIPALGPQPTQGRTTPWKSPPQLDSSTQSGFNVTIPKEGRRFALHRLDEPADVRVSFRSDGYAYFWSALLCVVGFLGGIYALTQSRRVRFIYFAGLGFFALIMAGAVTPGAAPVWRALFLGVFLAALIWLAISCWKGCRDCFERVRKGLAPRPAFNKPVTPPAPGPDKPTKAKIETPEGARPQEDGPAKESGDKLESAGDDKSENSDPKTDK